MEQKKKKKQVKHKFMLLNTYTPNKVKINRNKGQNK